MLLFPLVDYQLQFSSISNTIESFCSHVSSSSPGQKGGFGGFSRQVSLILACIACLPSLIGADSPSLQLMALTGLCGSIFQMKFQYKQSQKHLKMIWRRQHGGYSPYHTSKSIWMILVVLFFMLPCTFWNSSPLQQTVVIELLICHHAWRRYSWYDHYPFTSSLERVYPPHQPLSFPQDRQIDRQTDRQNPQWVRTSRQEQNWCRTHD